MMEKSNVIRKVQGLLNLGKDKAAFSAESETALRLATELLEQHGLSMQDIEMDNLGHVKADQFTEHETKPMMLWPWEKDLIRVVTSLMPVYLFFRSEGNGYKSFVWCGTKSDVVLADELWKHLRSELKRLARPEPTPLEKRSFLTGATQVLVNRAYEIEKAREPGVKAPVQSAGQALMVVKKQQVTAWVRSNHTFAKSYTRGSSVDDSAYARGAAAGRNMHLGPKRQGLTYTK